jgi:hypothetical protein
LVALNHFASAAPAVSAEEPQLIYEEDPSSLVSDIVFNDFSVLFVDEFFVIYDKSTQDPQQPDASVQEQQVEQKVKHQLKTKHQLKEQKVKREEQNLHYKKIWQDF